MSARGRIWKRLVDSGRRTRSEIVEGLGSRPSKQDMLDACEALGIEAPKTATNPELYQLLQQA